MAQSLWDVLRSLQRRQHDTQWAVVRKEVMETLLTADEEEFLQDTVKRMTQAIHESEVSYCHRFWDAVSGAWEPSDLQYYQNID